MRGRRKDPASQPTADYISQFVCSKCGRPCRLTIGMYSHKKVHKGQQPRQQRRLRHEGQRIISIDSKFELGLTNRAVPTPFASHNIIDETLQ